MSLPPSHLEETSMQPSRPVSLSQPPRRCAEAPAPGFVGQPPYRWSPHMPQFGTCFVQGLGLQPTHDTFPACEQVNSEQQISGSMNSSTYFTDLIASDLSVGDRICTQQSEKTPFPDDIIVQEGQAVATKGNQKRSKNFSDEEDILLVSAWLNVTLDPIQDVDQSRSTYWIRIHHYLHANKKFNPERSLRSFMNRWSGIQHDVNVFAGCLSKIEARNQSGCSIEDKQADACALFKAEDKQHRNFSYMHCWKILKNQPKWMDRHMQIGSQKSGNKKQKVMANSSPVANAPTADTSNSDDVSQNRSNGKKKEKQKLRQRSCIEAMDYLMEKKKEADAEKTLRKDERCNKAFALQEGRIRLKKEKFQFKREMEEDKIMNMDLSTMSAKQREYYEGWQNDILARRRKKN